jgi:hypothetical protein
VLAADVALEMADNRAALREVPVWISDHDYAASVFRYGLPEQVRPLIDLDVGTEPTYSDFLLHCARQLPQPVSYLEIGVSVGKSFYQLLRGLRSSHLVGLDLEDVSPALREHLGTQVERVDSWAGVAGSLRVAPSAIDRPPMHAGETWLNMSAPTSGMMQLGRDCPGGSST